MSRLGWVVPGLLFVALGAGAAPGNAQSNLDAGKSPARIFADTCHACHRSPRELKPTTPAFLRQHYTTGAHEAAAMAAYVATIGSDPQAVRQRRPPAMGAGYASDPASKPADQAKPAGSQPSAASVRSRRPSESVEGAKPLAQAAMPAPAEAATLPPSLLEAFEE